MIETSEKTVSEPIQAESLISEAGPSLFALTKVHENRTGDPVRQREPGSPEIEVSELLEPLAQSLTQAVGELNQRIHESEARQCATIEAALRKWEGERESKTAEHLIEIETMRMKSQSEINRVLRVMWLGTGVAGSCAAAALYLFRN